MLVFFIFSSKYSQKLTFWMYRCDQGRGRLAGSKPSTGGPEGSAGGSGSGTPAPARCRCASNREPRFSHRTVFQAHYRQSRPIGDSRRDAVCSTPRFDMTPPSSPLSLLRRDWLERFICSCMDFSTLFHVLHEIIIFIFLHILNLCGNQHEANLARHGGSFSRIIILLVYLGLHLPVLCLPRVVAWWTEKYQSLLHRNVNLCRRKT